VVRWSVIAIFLVLPLTGGLIYGWGLTGAGLSWVLLQVAGALYFVPRFCRETLGIRPALWYAHALRPVALFVAAYGGAWLAMDLVGDRSLASLGLAYMAGTLVFAGAAAALVGSELREVLRRLLSRVRERTHG
jgi:O-antigen/teichoic acid export membrane protein